MSTNSRVSLASAVHKDGHKAYEMRKEALFELADKDNDGVIDRAEFNSLYEVIRDDATKEHRETEVAEQAKVAANRRTKIASGLSLLMAFFLFLSLAGNLLIVYFVVDGQVTTTTRSDGSLMAKSGASEVHVAQSGKEVMLGLLPFLPKAAPKESLMAMPELVVVTDYDHPSGTPRFHALKVEKVEFQDPSTIWLRNGAENIKLDGASDATYTRADGSTFTFCSACSPIMLKSLIQSSNLDDAVANFEAAIEAGPVNANCADDAQTATILDAKGQADSTFMAMPSVCLAANSRRQLQKGGCGSQAQGPVEQRRLERTCFST